MGEEKKVDDSEAVNLLAVASPDERKQFQSNISSILFEDAPPPSPPNLTGTYSKSSPSSLVKRILNENGKRCDSPGAGDLDEAPGVIETPPVQKRSVKFNMADSPGSLNLEEASEEAILDRLTKTQDRLTQTQIDLSGEKAMRKRKDKSLVKLAKELQKRATAMESKDQQISKMTEMISHVTNKQRETASALQTSEEKYRSTVQDFEVKISTLTTQHMAECATLEHKYRSACSAHEAHLESSAQEQHSKETTSQQQQAQAKLEYDTRMAGLESKYETMLSQLRLEILQASVEADQLREKLLAVESGEIHIDDITIPPRRGAPIVKKQSNGKLAWTLVLVLSLFTLLPLALVLSIRFDVLRHATFLDGILPMEHLTMDAICAPASSGTTLQGKNVVVESPWWATSELKSTASKLCGSRPRIRLALQGGKLAAFDVTDGEKLLWKETAKQAVVRSDSIHLQNRRGQETGKVPAPWKSMNIA